MDDQKRFDELNQQQYDVVKELLNLARDTYDISEVSVVFRRLASTIVRLPSRGRREAILGVVSASFQAYADEQEDLGQIGLLLLEVALAIAAQHESEGMEALRPLMKSALSKLVVATELSTDVIAH